MEVVGVVADVVTSVAVLEPLAVYVPIAQTEASVGRSIVVRAAGDPDVTMREIVSTIRQLDSKVTVPPLQTLEERIGAQMSSQRFGAFVMGALGIIAFLLTLVGTYVLAESMAAMRMREMGIRAALGATGRELARIVLKETVGLVGVGLAGGLLLAWAGAGTIRTFLFGVQPLDPATLAIMSALILALAIVAVTLRPVLRAARVDLARVLREE
jgi:ABC-type antimicrobial peptide transport system permease subunit